MKGIFITGTDTNVGKTFIACKIAAELTSRNINVLPRKPIESGCQLVDGQLIADDATKLQAAASSTEAIETICRFRFEPAISPARAAKLNNQTITLKQLSRACTDSINATDFLLVEGAGGIYSPICDNALNADLIKETNLPLLLIADDKVGCINQVLLCLNAIQHNNLKVKAIVLNNISNQSLTNNAEDLSQFTSLPIFVFNKKSQINKLVDLLTDNL